MKKLILSFLSFFILTQTGTSQCSMVPVDLNSRVVNGSLIVEGTVINKQSFWNSAHNYVYTSNLIEVYKVFKGASVAYQIEVITEGGEVGLFKQTVEPSLQLQVGQTGMFMLNAASQPSQFGKNIYTIYADAQGFVKYDLSDGTARDVFSVYPSVETDLYSLVQQATGIAPIVLQPNFNASQKVSSSNSIAAVTGISPTTITAGTATSLTITGTGFGATQGTSYVEFPDADAGSGYIQPHATQYLSWSPTQIVVQVPTRTTSGGTLTTSGTAGTGQIRVVVAGTPTLSAQTLTISYGHLNVYYFSNNTIYNTRHVDLNGIGGITWQMFTGFNAMAAPKAAFQRAFQSWRCNTYINWALGSPVATNTIAFDAVNVIRFDIGAELPVGVLGRCTSYFSGCITGTVVNFYVSELDICFDDAANWQYGPAAPTGAQYDFESVTLHELGHGHQLSHVISATDVMNYSIANAVSKRVLNVDDIAGGTAVMARNLTGGVCGKPTMAAISPTACAAGTPTVAFTISPSATICAGQSITLTDISAGTPTAWSWTLTGGAPATSTISNPVVSYATPGLYSVSLVASNGFGSSSVLTKTISVLASPTVNVSGSTAICSGSSTTLTATGATSYTWNPGGLTGASQVLSPTTTVVYNVIGSNGVCSTNTNVTVNVTTPTTSASNTGPYCVGATIQLIAPVSTSYTWTGPSTFTSNLQNPTRTGATLAMAGTYTLIAAIGTCTAAATTIVTINPNPSAPTLGSNSPVCAGQTLSLTCGPIAGATYNWFGPCGFAMSIQNPVINNVTACANGTYTCIVTSVSGCTNTANTSVVVNPLPTIASAGSSQTTCISSPTTTLAGNTPTVGSGAWTLISGSGVITSSTTPNSSVTALLVGNNVFQWAISNSCGVSTSTMMIVVKNMPTSSSAGPNQNLCISSPNTTLAGNTPTVGAGAWTLISGSATISNSTSATTAVTGLALGNNIFQWTISNAPCASSASTVNIIVSTCVGIENTTANTNGVSIYPNPTQNNITINFGKVTSGKVSVYNALGQEILNKNVTEVEMLTIDLSSYSKGLYFVHVKPEGKTETLVKIIRD